MTNTSKTIVFFGTEDFSVPSLQALIDSGYRVSAVVTKPDSKQGRGQRLTPPIIKTIAQNHDIKVLQPSNLIDIKDDLTNLGNATGVLVSYGKIVPKQIIDLFSPGIVNVHPSLLPKYRGPSPIESAILNGDDKTGVTIMKLSEKMDAGPIYSQKEIRLDQTETGPQLSNKLAEIGSQELVKILPIIIDGSLPPVPQIEEDASYCKLLQKSDSILDPDQYTAADAERRVRALLAFPKTKYVLNGYDVIITKAHVINTPSMPTDVRFKDGLYLSIDELIAPSGRTMSAQDFINGYDLAV